MHNTWNDWGWHSTQCRERCTILYSSGHPHQQLDWVGVLGTRASETEGLLGVVIVRSGYQRQSHRHCRKRVGNRNTPPTEMLRQWKMCQMVMQSLPPLQNGMNVTDCLLQRASKLSCI